MKTESNFEADRNVGPSIDSFVERHKSAVAENEREAVIALLNKAGYQEGKAGYYTNPTGAEDWLEVRPAGDPILVESASCDRTLPGYKFIAEILFGDYRAVNFAKAAGLLLTSKVDAGAVLQIRSKKSEPAQARKISLLHELATSGDLPATNPSTEIVDKTTSSELEPYIADLNKQQLTELLFTSPVPGTLDEAGHLIRQLAFSASWRVLLIGRILSHIHVTLSAELKYRDWFKAQGFGFSERHAREYIAMYHFAKRIPVEKISTLILGNNGRPLIALGALAELGHAEVEESVVDRVVADCEAGIAVTVERARELLPKKNKRRQEQPSLAHAWQALQKESNHKLLKKDTFREALDTCVQMVEGENDQAAQKALLAFLRRLKTRADRPKLSARNSKTNKGVKRAKQTGARHGTASGG